MLAQTSAGAIGTGPALFKPARLNQLVRDLLQTPVSPRAGPISRPRGWLCAPRSPTLGQPSSRPPGTPRPGRRGPPPRHCAPGAPAGPPRSLPPHPGLGRPKLASPPRNGAAPAGGGERARARGERTSKLGRAAPAAGGGGPVAGWGWGGETSRFVSVSSFRSYQKAAHPHPHKKNKRVGKSQPHAGPPPARGPASLPLAARLGVSSPRVLHPLDRGLAGKRIEERTRLPCLDQDQQGMPTQEEKADSLDLLTAASTPGNNSAHSTSCTHHTQSWNVNPNNFAQRYQQEHGVLDIWTQKMIMSCCGRQSSCLLGGPPHLIHRIPPDSTTGH
ncbi:uncharacterized protein LOC106009684 [Heterocephalus glaber]|uniref:Uncharacterized protein LOC106009684 n=1 Tax=Heterocephalus glaber TaxID=10181 RepID=A0AAX6T3I1_HETGA|nr:uncharacterized protein LOC106009684 [Heterocephalus glaber]